MLAKKVFSALTIALGMISLIANAQEPLYAEISPGSGVLLDTQKFDMVFSIPASNLAPMAYAVVYLNGHQDMTDWFKRCFQKQDVLDEPFTTYQCTNQSGMVFGVGEHELSVKMYLMDGSSYVANTFYKVIKNQHPTTLPFSFSHLSSNPANGSGIYVSLGEKLRILASGRIITWASNPSFPVATPKGSVSCNASSCLIPGALTGALLVKIGPTGRWMVAGDYLSLTADRPGELIFAVNDKNLPEGWADNLGSFDVTITK
jgi:hypothetical protein